MGGLWGLIGGRGADWGDLMLWGGCWPYDDG